MPANLYGTANPNPLPTAVQTIGNVDVAIPPGAETNFAQLVFPPATSGGWYYPSIWGLATVVLSATPPTALQFGARIGAGADFSAYAVRTQLLTASAQFEMTLFLCGFTTLISNPFTPTTLFVSANATANGFTVGVNGTVFLGQWVRAPDQ